MKIDVNLNDAEKVPCQLGINPLYARNNQLIPYIYLFSKLYIHPDMNPCLLLELGTLN